jgi:hypothetical protein
VICRGLTLQIHPNLLASFDLLVPFARSEAGLARLGGFAEMPGLGNLVRGMGSEKVTRVTAPHKGVIA